MRLTNAQHALLMHLKAIEDGTAESVDAPDLTGIRNMTVSEVLQGMEQKATQEDRFGRPAPAPDVNVVVTVVRKLTYTGPSAWVQHTLARSIDGTLNCGPGMTVTSEPYEICAVPDRSKLAEAIRIKKLLKRKAAANA